jgi:hypothetical protein
MEQAGGGCRRLAFGKNEFNEYLNISISEIITPCR